MKTDVQPSAETEALHWATEFFRKNATEMSPEISKQIGVENAVTALLFLHDSQDQERRDEGGKIIRREVSRAWYGNRESSQIMRMFAAALVERRHQLPDELREFVVGFLLNPDKPEWPTRMVKIVREERGDSAPRDIDESRSRVARTPGKGANDLAHRNTLIWAAVEHIRRTWGFPATRNEATTNASATSIVQKALAQGAGLHLSESAVIKAWESGLAANQRIVALDPNFHESIIDDQSEKIVTD